MIKNKIKEIAPVAISLALCMVFLYLITGTSCIFRATIGIPCPGCGLTRAGLSALKLNFRDAFFFHPLFWLVPVIFVLAAYKKFSSGGKNAKWINVFFKVSLIAAIVLYFVRMILFFPHTEPMTFNNNTILLQIIRFMKSIFT